MIDEIQAYLESIFTVEKIGETSLLLYFRGIELTLTISGDLLTISGDSPYEPLPHSFRFRDVGLVLPIIVPFLYQCFDGVRRI